jgi:hypothetical protein
MTGELEELLAAAKVMAMTNTVLEMERLHRAITAVEATRTPINWNILRSAPYVHPNETSRYDFENDGLRKEV